MWVPGRSCIPWKETTDRLAMEEAGTRSISLEPLTVLSFANKVVKVRSFIVPTEDITI